MCVYNTKSLFLPTVVARLNMMHTLTPGNQRYFFLLFCSVSIKEFESTPACSADIIFSKIYTICIYFRCQELLPSMQGWKRTTSHTKSTKKTRHWVVWLIWNYSHSFLNSRSLLQLLCVWAGSSATHHRDCIVEYPPLIIFLVLFSKDELYINKILCYMT